jgi:POT family proton-dependent oligopeptide transporter
LTTLTANTPPPGHKAGHPRGLAIIFLTEMWERFSYYGMRALLVLYLVNSLGFERADALAMYGTYTMLVYFTPVIGGWIADKYLGMRQTAVIGAVVMMLGHFAMAVPSLLYVALGLLVVGNGFFKPNTSSLVGELYDGPDDARLDGGYTIFYMGINLGSIFSGLVCGTLGEKFGWHYGFASAGIGMAIGLFTFVGFQRLLGGAGLRKAQPPIGWHNLPVILGFTAASVAVVYAVLAAWPYFMGAISGVSTGQRIVAGLVIILAAIFSWRRSNARNPAYVPLTHAERKRVTAVFILAFFVVFFWMGFEQAGGSMSLFADKQTDRHIGSWEVPATWFQSINPLLIVILAPFFSMMWTRINNSRFELPDVAKAALGMIVLGLGFVVMTVAQNRADTIGMVGPQWLFFAYALHTMGELMLSPIGLALVSRAAPARIAALLMGVWLFFIGIANKLAGSLESMLQGSNIQPYFLLTCLSIGMGVLLLLLTPILNRMLQSRDAIEPEAPALTPALA